MARSNGLAINHTSRLLFPSYFIHPGLVDTSDSLARLTNCIIWEEAVFGHVVERAGSGLPDYRTFIDVLLAGRRASPDPSGI